MANRAHARRFTTLDAYRGLAALVIAIHHADGFLGSWDPSSSVLAVDLFFVLSGYVMAHSYDGDLAAGETWRFLIRRVIRLYPLYLLGLGLSVFAAFDALTRSGRGLEAVLTVLAPNAVALPSPAIEVYRDPFLFPLNPPSWSLFFEFWVANLLFAAGWKWLHGRALAAVIGLSLIGLLVSAWSFGSLSVGWSAPSLPGGFPRVLFSYFAGVALRRAQPRLSWLPRLPAPVLCACLLALLFGPDTRVYRFPAVVAGFPLLVLLGAGAQDARPWIGEQLGRASYALYALHWPLLVLVAGMVGVAGLRPSAMLEIGFALGALALAWLIERYVDQPVRAWLGARLPHGPRAAAEPAQRTA